MARRWARWLLLAAAALFFLKCFVGAATPGTVAGFLVCGGLWVFLTRRKVRELDSPRPRRPFEGGR